jgi:hypothetical protein
MAANPNIEALLDVFDEPLRDADRRALPTAKPALPASGRRLGRTQHEANGHVQLPSAAPATPNKGGSTVKGLVATLVGISLVPMAILFVLLWQDMMRPRAAQEGAPAEPASTASLPVQSGSTQPKHAERPPLEIALSSPERIEANTGDMVEFPIAIDATDALPARSIVAVTALPEGASFSAGRPYGVSGWSLRPDEIGSLQLRLPERSAASDLHLELVAGDGTVLAQSETRLSIAAASPEVETTASIDSAPPVQVARAETSAAGADLVSLPQRNPQASAGDASGLKVNTVKVVTIEPPKPKPTRPHDGAYGLGSPADDAQGEWMVTKTAVDMHAKAQQSSETVKVADKGLKLRVTARDKRWIQVTDPATSTTGWIYDRFLQPVEPPAQ